MEQSQSESEQHQTIQLAAYCLWQHRGSPLGSPEVDWFHAEEQLRDGTEVQATEPTLVAAAKTVGSALGAVAGFVASIGD